MIRFRSEEKEQYDEYSHDYRQGYAGAFKHGDYLYPKIPNKISYKMLNPKLSTLETKNAGRSMERRHVPLLLHRKKKL